MRLEGSNILILGGSGLVGHAVARRLLAFHPARLVLVALREPEVRRAAEELRRLGLGPTAVEVAWGDVFLPAELAQLDRAAIAADPARRAALLEDLYGEFTDSVLRRSLLFQLLDRYRPDAVVDCLNTATAFAYQNVYQSVQDLLAAAREGRVTVDLAERHALTLPLPQLIRHLQIAAEAFQRTGVKVYVKIGTSGTGGMGLNIPYTHSEERPSRMLLTKSALAGAHSLLLFLLARTPGAPATKEIKPTAVVGWREICYGLIKRAGRSIPRVDCPQPLPLERAFAPGARGWRELGDSLASVYADTGENGLFARQEFEVVTSLGSMELITPEEIADYVVMELEGRPTGHDVIAALDASTSGPTYRAGVVRAAAIERLARLEREHGVRSVAFEMLGPPRLTKMLYEAQVLGELAGSVGYLARSDPADLARRAAQAIARDADLRSTILSIGLPIIVQGDLVYRGATVLHPPEDGDASRAIAAAWVDLREPNCATWIARAGRIVEQAQQRQQTRGTSSGEEWDAMVPEDPVSPARMAAWVFRYEEGGERIKR
jgi:nucleoside-diphosphate-sugar epimerase